MPMLVGALGRQAVDGLNATLFIPPIAELPAMRPQPVTQGPLIRGHARPRFMVVHCQLLQRLTGADLGRAPGLPNRVF